MVLASDLVPAGTTLVTPSLAFQLFIRKLSLQFSGLGCVFCMKLISY